MATIIESIRTFVATCPLLDDAFPVNVDYLSNETTCYSIEPVPSNSIIEQYIDGSSKRQFLFVLSSREPYGEDYLQNLTNNGFYQAFSEWLETQSKAGQFPTLVTGMTAQKISASGIGYVLETGTDTARYQIQCSLEYEKGA